LTISSLRNSCFRIHIFKIKCESFLPTQRSAFSGTDVKQVTINIHSSKGAGWPATPLPFWQKPSKNYSLKLDQNSLRYRAKMVLFESGNQLHLTIMLVRQEQFLSPTLTCGDTLWLFFKTTKPCVRMFCFTWNICQIIFDTLGIEIWQHVPVIVVKKITNVLWTACICQLIFKNLNTYTTIIKYKSAWKMFVCMTIIKSIKFLNNFIDTYLSTTFYILYSPHFIFDLDHIILHWIEGIMSLLRHSILQQSLLQLLILRQWPIVFAGAFSNPNAVRDCPFKLKGAWFLSRSRMFFSYAALLF
jgi:hypothetical protein